MSKYILKMRTWNVAGPLQYHHSGFWLEEYENGNTVKAYAVDLDPTDPIIGKVRFKIGYVNEQNLEDELNNPDYSFYNVFTSGTDEYITGKSLRAFNKIMMEAAILNMYSDKLNYFPTSYNCNTSTAFFANEFIPEVGSFSMFFNRPGNFVGKEYDFASTREVQNVHTIVKKIISDMEAKGYDFGSEILPLNCTLNADKLSFEIGGEKFTILNEVSDVVTFTEGNQIVYSIDYFAASSTTEYSREISFFEGSNKYYGGKGPDIIFGGVGNDYIDAGGGANIVYGKGGSDTYMYKSGYGTLTIEDIVEDGQGDVDKIVFEKGIRKSHLTFKAFDSDLYVYITNQNNGQPCIIIKKFFAEVPQRIEAFEFESSLGDKITIGQTQLKYTIDSTSEVVTHRGTEFGDVIIINTEKENVVYTGNGNDIVTCKDGDYRAAAKIDTPNTKVYGGAGNDIIAIGHGNHEIHAGGGFNRIYIGNGVSDIYLEEENSDTVEVQELFAGHVVRIHNFNPKTEYSTWGMEYWQKIGNDVLITKDGKGRLVLVDALQYFDFGGQDKVYKNPLKK